MLRREALDEVGGIAQETVTEDAHTALKLHGAGWRSVYLDLPQAAGLATERFSFHVAQRVRWARGMIQILRLDNPLTRPGLTLAQRACYGLAISYFLFGIPRLVLLLTPAAYLLLGLHPIQASPMDILVMVLPHLLLVAACISAVNGTARHSFWPEVYETAIAPWIAGVAIVTLLAPRRGRFNVTPKGGQAGRYHFDVRSASPILALLALCIAGVVAVPWRLASEPDAFGTLSLTLAWNLYNMALLGAAVAACLERPERRPGPRVRVAGRALVYPADVDDPERPALTAAPLIEGVLVDLSETGARLRLPAGSVPDRLVLSLESPWGTRSELAGRLVRCTELSGGVQQVQVTFAPLSASTRHQVLQHMFTEPDAWVRERLPPDEPVRAAVSVALAPARALLGWARSRGVGDAGVGGAPLVRLPSRACECGRCIFGWTRRCPSCWMVSEPPPRHPLPRGTRLMAAAAVVALAIGAAPDFGVDPAVAAGMRPVRAASGTPGPVLTIEGLRVELGSMARDLRLAPFGVTVPAARAEKRLWAVSGALDRIPLEADHVLAREAVEALRAATESLHAALRADAQRDPAAVEGALDAVDAHLAVAAARLIHLPTSAESR